MVAKFFAKMFDKESKHDDMEYTHLPDSECETECETDAEDCDTPD
jgi:hypothetical protein